RRTERRGGKAEFGRMNTWEMADGLPHQTRPHEVNPAGQAWHEQRSPRRREGEQEQPERQLMRREPYEADESEQKMEQGPGEEEGVLEHDEKAGYAESAY